MRGTALHAGILAQWIKILCYHGRQWDFIMCNASIKVIISFSVGGGGAIYLYVYIHLRFKHAQHETTD